MDNPIQNQQQHEEDRVDPQAPYLARDSALLQQPLTPPSLPTNSGESDMATEDFNVMIFLNFPQSPSLFPTLSSPPPPSPPLYFPTSSNSMVVNPPSPPPRSPSSSNSIVVYQGLGQSSMDNPLQNQQQHEDLVDQPLYIAGDMALLQQELLQFWIDAPDDWGPRGGIMRINKENLPQRSRIGRRSAPFPRPRPSF